MLKNWIKENKSDMQLLINFVGPMVLTQIIQVFFQIGDQAIIGRTLVHEFAAVGIASSFLFLITGTIGMISMAFNIIGGRYLGENNLTMFGKAFSTSVNLCIVIGLLCEIIILLFGKLILKNIYGLEPLILEPATEYLYIGGLGIGLNMVLFNFSAFFKNINKTKIFLMSFIPASIINVFFDYVLVYGKFGFPKLGVKGAAIGTVLGLAVNMIIYIFAFFKWKKISFSFSLNKAILAKLMKLYFPLALQDLIEFTLFAMMLSILIVRIGVESIATYSVVTTLLEFLLIPMYGFSGSCLTLTAQRYGNKNGHFLKLIPLSITLGLIVTIPLSILITVFANPVASLMTDKISIITLVVHILPWAAFFSLINGIQIIVKSALQAIDLEKWVLVYSTCIYAMLLLFLYIFIHQLDLLGIYIGLGLGYGLLLCGYLFKIRKISLQSGQYSSEMIQNS
ncbi:MATE family efflux transporter [Paenibacillus senegalimassiliensis]|uniref:MATE family efflux transporter n=1 Tax=Paenibacillus senegalimassiliensis TaxID=1737426 RepID=UPI00073F72BB|nr:MATE family efflux transporter [Paenibacillus senegalimassiliensis]